MKLGKVQRASTKRAAQVHDADHPGTHSDGTPGHEHGSAGHGHGWMMIICCIPMIVIAIVLVATGVAGYGFLFVALMCTAMMAMMMGGGSSKGGDRGHRH